MKSVHSDNVCICNNTEIDGHVILHDACETAKNLNPHANPDTHQDTNNEGGSNIAELNVSRDPNDPDSTQVIPAPKPVMGVVV